MSRGPGKIARAVEAAFRANPDDILLVEDLARAAYPGVNRIEKKHRGAVIRAAVLVMSRTGWGYKRHEAPGGSNIYFNLRSVRSYVLARLRADFCQNGTTTDELRQAVDGRHPNQQRYARDSDGMKLGGAWWRHVQIHCADLDGRADEAAGLRDELSAIIAEKMRAFHSRV